MGSSDGEKVLKNSRAVREDHEQGHNKRNGMRADQHL